MGAQHESHLARQKSSRRPMSACNYVVALATCDRRCATERIITKRVRGHELHNSPQPDVLGLIGNITYRFPGWEILALHRTIA